MSLISRIAGTPEDRAAHRDREETADFVAANARVVETSSRLPWLTRG